MIYNFKDVTQSVEASESVLPSEALNIEGEYIENLIPGYRTLHVAGREPLSPELVTFSTGSRDGSTILSKRFPERILTVTYQLVSKTNEEFREAFNKLGGILNVTDAVLIFNDEQDKYFIGTPCTIDEVEPGRNAVVGKFEILCADPCKRSVTEYEAVANLDEKTILIDYKGSHRAFPILEAQFFKEEEHDTENDFIQNITGLGDCGYVAFFNEDEKIIQVGNPDEADGIANAYKKSQALILQKFEAKNAWTNTASSLWNLNSTEWEAGKVYQTGNLAMKEAPTIIKNDVTHYYKTSTILDKAKSTVSEPPFYYTITAKPSQRSEEKVKISFAITASLGRNTAYFGKGYTLKGALYFAEKWHEFTFKKSSERWEGTSGHTINFSAWFDAFPNSGTVTGIKFKAYREDGLGMAGTLQETKCKQVNIPPWGGPAEEKTYFLAPSNYGATTYDAHGPSIVRFIPRDDAGDLNATDFTFSYTHQFCIGKGADAKKQIGGFMAKVFDQNGDIMAMISVNKVSHGNKASLRFEVNNGRGVMIRTDSIDVAYKSDYLDSKHEKNLKSCVIEKFGDTISFKAAGREFSFLQATLDKVASAIEFQFIQYTQSPAIEFNGISNVKFVKHNCNTMKDIPNIFGSGDSLQIRCDSAEIFHNGYLRPDLGALGNDWEKFYLKPGLNQIGFAYSDWIQDEYAPEFKVKYREIYL